MFRPSVATFSKEMPAEKYNAFSYTYDGCITLRIAADDTERSQSMAKYTRVLLQ
jgi:hypothetical protein